MAPLPEPQRILVAACFESVAFEYGETVVAEGEPANAYFVIASGHARVLTAGPDGAEVPLNLLSPGDAFGEVALVEQAPRSATVRASSALEMLRLDRSVFALIRIHPSLREAFGIDARALHNGDFLRLHPAFAGLTRERLMELVEEIHELVMADLELAPSAEEFPQAACIWCQADAWQHWTPAVASCTASIRAMCSGRRGSRRTLRPGRCGRSAKRVCCTSATSR